VKFFVVYDSKNFNLQLVQRDIDPYKPSFPGFFSLTIQTGLQSHRFHSPGGPKEKAPPALISAWHLFESGGISCGLVIVLD
jgi:hypothetical protein